MNNSLIILAAGLSSRMKKSKSSDVLSDTILNQANNIEKGLIGIDKKGNPWLIEIHGDLTGDQILDKLAPMVTIVTVC